MNKKLISIIGGIFLGIILILFLILNIFKITYFNEKYYKVPDLKSYTFEEGEEFLKHSGLSLKKVGEEFSEYPMGEIFLQEPEEDSIVKKGRTIKVWVSNGTALTDVPNLVGENFLEAKVIAEQKGLILDRVITIKKDGRYNEVIATDPPTNTLLNRGEKISFLVNGSDQVVNIIMPDLVGISFDNALKTLTNKSLIVGNVEFVSIPDLQKNIVVDTSVKAGTKIPAGASVDLTINN